MIKVLIVDDSVLIQKVLTEIFSKDPSIQVVGVADDPYDAREKIKTLKPDGRHYIFKKYYALATHASSHDFYTHTKGCAVYVRSP